MPPVPHHALSRQVAVAAPRPARRNRMKRRVLDPRALEQIPVWADIAPARVTISDEGAIGLEMLLDGLSPEQRRAVTHGDGPLLVLAGAGTGKTQVITRRIAWLIATRRARPAEILALPSTDKAAAEMQVRAEQPALFGPTVGTRPIRTGRRPMPWLRKPAGSSSSLEHLSAIRSCLPGRVSSTSATRSASPCAYCGPLRQRARSSRTVFALC